MLTRRRFLRCGSLAAAVSFPGARLGAQRGQSERAQQDSSLPPSIRSLKSMRGEARPITNDERRARLAKARRLMTENKIDAVMLTGGTAMVYFSNIRWGLSERMFAMILPAKGDAFFVCPSFEEDRAREQIAAGPFSKDVAVLTWHEHESPSALVARGLKDRGIAAGALGAEETVRHVFSNSVAEAAPAIKIVSATPVTAGCRMVKDAHEIELMRLASRVTLRAYEAAYLALKEGITQNDFAELVSTAHSRLGFQGSAGVQAGPYSALPHGSLTPQTVREGTILLIDGGCSVEGYASDISRTFVLGRPTDKMKRVFEIERKAQDAALAAARPGVPCEAVDAAARKVIVDAGFGPDYASFSHRVGHGMGMDGHEWPYLVRGNTLPLAPGMVFSDEPGIYIRGEFGVRVEDDMLITPTGAELFTPQSPSLENPFGRT